MCSISFLLINRSHRCYPFRQNRAIAEIILVVGINEQQGTAFDRINDRFADRLRKGGTTEATAQPTGRSNDGRIGISRSVNNDCPLFGTVVDSFFQPVKHQLIPVFPLISIFSQEKSQRTFKRTVLVGERSCVIPPAILPV